MPYIEKEKRDALEWWQGNVPSTTGELTYVIVDVIKSYLWKRGESYQTYNDIIGSLETAKLELYRRKIAKYEDKKKEENGDVF